MGGLTEGRDHHINGAAGTASYWQEIIDALERGAMFAQRYKRSMVGPIIDQTLDTYYRLRAAGSKVTLKQLATQAEISYSYLRLAFKV